MAGSSFIVNLSGILNCAMVFHSNWIHLYPVIYHLQSNPSSTEWRQETGDRDIFILLSRHFVIRKRRKISIKLINSTCITPTLMITFSIFLVNMYMCSISNNAYAAYVQFIRILSLSSNTTDRAKCLGRIESFISFLPQNQRDQKVKNNFLISITIPLRIFNI